MLMDKVVHFFIGPKVESIETRDKPNSEFIEIIKGRIVKEKDIPDYGGEDTVRSRQATDLNQDQIKRVPNESMRDLNIEENRLATFHRWSNTVVNKEKLALLGFYFIGPEDTVKCYFCKVEIGRWELGDSAYVEHKRWSPNCPLLKHYPTNNVPRNVDLLNAEIPNTGYDLCGNQQIEYRPDAYAEGGRDEVSTLVQHGDFALESERLKSFKNWPKSMRQKPEELSDAGFFYIGKGDAVKCYSCGGGLKDWEEDDQPWEQHAMWYENCRYLNLIKGENYIKAVQAKLSGTSTSEATTANTNVVQQKQQENNIEVSESNESTKKIYEEEPKEESKLCKICFANEFNTVFFPCGHIIACAKCASSVSSCPLCRKHITDVKRIYFS